MDEDNKRSLMQAEEIAWIQSFVAGDKMAFDALVIRYKDRVFNLCYRMLGDYDDADDCAQEAFIRAYRSLRRFRFDSSFSTWLYAIAVNVCRNRLKSAEYRNRRRAVSINAAKKADRKANPLEIEDPSPSPLVQLAQKEKEALLLKAMDLLSPEAKSMVVLRDIQGLSYEEVSEITHTRLGTVKSRLARARRQLGELLKGVI